MTDQLDDLLDAVDAIARILGGPVAIEDVDFRVLAYSALADQPNDEARRDAILNRRMPDYWVRRFTEDGLRRRLMSTEDVISLDMLGPGFKPRLITGIPASGTVVGFLWVMEGKAPLPPDVTDVMRRFAVAVGPELARRSGGAENPQGHLVRQFLAGAISPSQVAEAMHVSEDVAVAVIAIAVVTDGATETTLRSRALRVLNLHLTSSHQEPWLVGSADQRVYLLEAVPRDRGRAEQEARLASMVRHLEAALGVRVLAAIGSRAPLSEGATRSRAQADLAMRVLVSSAGELSVGSYDHLRSDAILHEVGRFLRGEPLLADGAVSELADHDRRHGTDYLPSLSAYLEAFGDFRRAAETLYIHPNTLRYRLKKLADVAGVDLGDPRERLALQLLLLTRSTAELRVSSGVGDQPAGTAQ